MSLTEFLLLSLAFWVGVGFLAASVLCFVASRAKRVVKQYPPILPPVEWTEADEAAFRVFAEGGAR